MADDAGFAAALTVRERVLSDALLFAYCRASFSRKLTFPVLGTGPSANFDVFLAPPTITCDGTQNAAVVGLELTGALSITESGGPEVQGVVAQLEVAVPPQFTLTAGQLSLSPTFTDVAVTQWTFTVVFGSGFTPTTDAYLRSDVFRDRLTTTIQFALSHGLLPLPQVDISFVGSAIVAAAAPSNTTATVPARVVDGALIVGLNVVGFMPPWQPEGDPDGITLIGDATALEDFAGVYDLAAVTNPFSLPIQLGQVEQEIVSAVGSGGTIQYLNLTAADGQFDVSGGATNSSGTATFSFAVVPHLTASRPGAAFEYLKKPVQIKPRQWRGLWFSTDDVAVDVDANLSTWDEVLLGIGTVLSAGVLLVSVLETESFIAYEYGMTIAAGTSGAPVALVQHVTSSALDNVTLRIAVDEYAITTDGTYTGVTVTPKPLPAALIGPQSIPADLRSDLLSYTIRLPVGVVPDDPAVHVQWTVIDPVSGTVYVNDDAAALNRTTFTFVPDQVHAGLATYAVGCRVYRTAGPQSTDIVNDAINLAIGPELIEPAYVLWAYDVQRPEVQFDWPSDSWRYLGEALAHRHSNIHRIHNGCKMASKSSRYLYQIKYLDALPFPVSEIDTYRWQLCDYCFYGGPAGLRATL